MKKKTRAYPIWVMRGIFLYGMVCLDRRSQSQEVDMGTPSIALTEDQWAKIQKDAAGSHMLTENEVGKLALLLNKKVNIPFMSEKTEGKILIKLVRRVDAYLYKALPNELYELIRDSADGISDDEADEIPLCQGSCHILKKVS